MKTSKFEKFGNHVAEHLTRTEMKGLVGGNFPVTCTCSDGTKHMAAAGTPEEAWEMCTAICGE